MEQDEIDFDGIISDRKMPSHDWSKKNAGNLAAIIAVAESEKKLIEAIDIAQGRQWSNIASFKDSAEKNVGVAVNNLADIYLKHGVAIDEASAKLKSKQAKIVINNHLDHSSVIHHR